MISRLAQPVGIAVALAAVTMAACNSSSRTSVGPSPVKCQVTLATTADTIASNGGGGTVDVTTNPECAWTASPSATWISSLSPANGQGNGQIQFRAVANPQPATRLAEIDVNGSRVSVRQEATPCQFDITPSTQAIDDSGGTGTIALTTIAGCGWNATSNAEWITVTAGQSGNRSGSVAFSVAANPGSERTGTVSVADDTFTVIQEGALVCSYALEPSEGSVDGLGGQGSFVVATQSECSWTAVEYCAVDQRDERIDRLGTRARGICGGSKFRRHAQRNDHGRKRGVHRHTAVVGRELQLCHHAFRASRGIGGRDRGTHLGERRRRLFVDGREHRPVDHHHVWREWNRQRFRDLRGGVERRPGSVRARSRSATGSSR